MGIITPWPKRIFDRSGQHSKKKSVGCVETCREGGGNGGGRLIKYG